MKADNYLSLCMEQAAKSALRYRHGAIIVRGGKVIGQGYNDYRPGFDGGALKTGLLSRRVNKMTNMEDNNMIDPNAPTSNKNFMPFETMVGGGGKMANTPLSMHSEMMAIHSALSASGTLASTAVPSQKPCSKLSSDSKRKARLRRDAVKAYVEAVCGAAEQQYAKSQVQEWRFEGTASGSQYAGKRAVSSGKAGEPFGETWDGEREREEETEKSSSWSRPSQWMSQQQASWICV